MEPSADYCEMLKIAYVALTKKYLTDTEIEVYLPKLLLNQMLK